MKPIHFPGVDVIVTGRAAAEDLPAQRVKVLMRPPDGEEPTFRPGLQSVWEPTPEERAAIAAGANIALIVASDPQPPVWLGLEGDA